MRTVEIPLLSQIRVASKISRAYRLMKNWTVAFSFSNVYSVWLRLSHYYRRPCKCEKDADFLEHTQNVYIPVENVFSMLDEDEQVNFIVRIGKNIFITFVAININLKSVNSESIPINQPKTQQSILVLWILKYLSLSINYAFMVKPFHWFPWNFGLKILRSLRLLFNAIIDISAGGQKLV